MTIHKVNNKSGKIIRTGLGVGKSVVATTTNIIQTNQTSKLQKGLGRNVASSGDGESNVYPSPSVSPANLGTSGLFGAYSLNRRIVSGYTGNLFRGVVISNSSVTPQTIDFSQSSGIVDFSVLTDKQCSIFPTIVYDQSGNGRHFQSQHIVSGRNNYDRILRYCSDTQTYGIFGSGYGLTNNSFTGYSSPVYIYLDARDAQFGLGLDGLGSGWGIQSGTGSISVVVNGAAYDVSTPVLPSNGKSIIWINGTQIGVYNSTSNFVTSSVPSGTLRSSSVGFSVGLRGAASQFDFTGITKEWVVWTTAMTNTEITNLYSSLA